MQTLHFFGSFQASGLSLIGSENVECVTFRHKTLRYDRLSSTKRLSDQQLEDYEAVEEIWKRRICELKFRLVVGSNPGTTDFESRQVLGFFYPSTFLSNCLSVLTQSVTHLVPGRISSYDAKIKKKIPLLLN